MEEFNDKQEAGGIQRKRIALWHWFVVIGISVGLSWWIKCLSVKP